jgi:hypothetical protein
MLCGPYTELNKQGIQSGKRHQLAFLHLIKVLGERYGIIYVWLVRVPSISVLSVSQTH